LVPEFTKEAGEGEYGTDGGIYGQRNDIFKDCLVLVAGVLQRVILKPCLDNFSRIDTRKSGTILLRDSYSCGSFLMALGLLFLVYS
jgi:hypothetical protein